MRACPFSDAISCRTPRPLTTNSGAMSCAGSIRVSRTRFRNAALVRRRRGLRSTAAIAAVGIASLTAAASCRTLGPAASAATLKPASRATALVRGPIVIAGRSTRPPSSVKPRTAEPEANTTAATSCSSASRRSSRDSVGPSTVSYAVTSSTSAPRRRRTAGRSGSASEARTSRTRAPDASGMASASAAPFASAGTRSTLTPFDRSAAAVASPTAAQRGPAATRGSVSTPAALVTTIQSNWARSGHSTGRRRVATVGTARTRKPTDSSSATSGSPAPAGRVTSTVVIAARLPWRAGTP